MGILKISKQTDGTFMVHVSFSDFTPVRFTASVLSLGSKRQRTKNCSGTVDVVGFFRSIRSTSHILDEAGGFETSRTADDNHDMAKYNHDVAKFLATTYIHHQHAIVVATGYVVQLCKL